MIDTTNKFAVAISGGKVVIMRPPGPAGITPDDALLLAATLAAIAEPFAANSFEEVLEAVMSV
jgi:hypothetical protein